MARFISFLALVLLTASTHAFVRVDTTTHLSLVTCSPGKEIYSKFGHTAIRVQDADQQIDVIFNYGLFSYFSENFIYRFVKGETDYMLGVQHTDSFMEEYELSGRRLFEQPLLLTHGEKVALVEALLVNYQPENRTYRYNFVYDNCATRPYQLIKKQIQGVLVAPTFDQQQDTYRKIIAYYTDPNSWSFWGISLVFGTDADKVMTPEERLFLPEELMEFTAEANVVEDGELRRLTESTAIAPFTIAKTPWLFAPWWVMILFSVITVLNMIVDFRRRKNYFGIEAVTYLILGLCGVIVFFLMFFSEHPMVRHNYNLLFANPLFLVLFVLTLFKKGRQWLQKISLPLLCYYLIAAALWLWSPQVKHPFIWFIFPLLISREFLTWLIVNANQKIKISEKKRTPPTAIVLIVVALLGTTTASAQRHTPPRLAVVVVVDGLQMQNLEQMEHYFEQGGLLTLLKEGTQYTQVTFPQFTYGGSETVATIMTGTTPFYHGISNDFVFDTETHRISSILSDPSFPGIGFRASLSPKRLQTTTFIDELRLQKQKQSKIYAVGIDPHTTILMGAHSANATAWLDRETQQWVTTSYYPQGLPIEAYNMNNSGRIKEVANRLWSNRMAATSYLRPTEKELKNRGFSYTPNQTVVRGGTETILSETPSVNTLVVELALNIQNREDLGKDTHTDILMLQLTTATPESESDLIHSAEQEDMYIRLNQELGFLMEQLTTRIGKENLLLMVIGKPAKGRTVTQMEQQQIATGTFNVGRAAALLNTYLMALYGHDRWVEGGYGNHIYLNKLLLERRGIRLSEIQERATQFLLEFEGVQSAMSAQQLLQITDNSHDDLINMRNSYHKKGGGDLLFTLQPGWKLADEQGNLIDRIAEISPTVPLFIWGGEHGYNRITQPLSATKVAPYVCDQLRINYPNGVVVK